MREFLPLFVLPSIQGEQKGKNRKKKQPGRGRKRKRGGGKDPP